MPDSGAPPHWPEHSTPIGALIRERDWAATPLGPIAAWPQSLRTTVDILLASPLPMIVLWGPEGRMIYNAGYAVIAGDKHPGVLGRGVLEGWPEVADFNREILARVRGGQTLTMAAQHLVLIRGDGPQSVWLDLTYSPVRDETGAVAGVLAIVVETTDQVLDERRRRQAEESLQLALNADAVVGLWDWDIRIDRVRGDRRFAQAFSVDFDAVPNGVPVATLLGALHDDDRPGVEAAIADTLATGRPFRSEFRVRQPDGGFLWVEANGTCVFGEDGAAQRFSGILIGINERKLAEQTRWESQEQFSSLVEAVPHHVWAAQPDGQLHWFNARVYEYTGQPPDTLNGDSWGRVVHPADLPDAVRSWTQAVASGTIYETEFRIRRGADGNDFRWFLVRAVPVHDAAGRIIRWIGTNTDIDDQRRAAVALAEMNATLEQRVDERTSQLVTSQRQLRTFYDFSSECHVLLLAMPDGSFVFEDANPAVLRLYGRSRAEVVGRTTEQLFEPEVAAELNRNLAACLAAPGPYRYERRQGGTIVEAVCVAVPIEPGEFFQRIVVTARDVGDSRQLEEQLRQSQKMEAVGQLTGGIAHDFNNLLQGIVGSLNLIQRRISQGRIGELERFLNGAMASSNRAAALTHRLLAFSRRQPLDPQVVNANQLIGSLEDLLRRTMGEQVAIEVVASGGLWPTLCDQNQLENALLNLAINARDAMPDGGRLTIETCNAHLDGNYAAQKSDVIPGQYVCLSVTDTGTGMAAETMARAFDPFFTTKPSGQGTGLGLSMIYGFARQSEGYAHIYSELGRGTTVKLYLPRYRGAETDAAADATVAGPEAAHTAGAGQVVLVIEDEAIVRGLIVDVLHDLGYGALEAADGPAGLNILRSAQRIDLLISDVGLPGLNGRQVADAARVERPDLKVLFMTGYAENAAVARGFLEPGMQLITKPFALDMLAGRIRDILAL